MEKELEVTCLSCGHEFTIGEDEVYEDDMGHYAVCGECEATFDIDKDE